MRIASHHVFAVHFENEPQNAVRRRMLRAKVELQRLELFVACRIGGFAMILVALEAEHVVPVEQAVVLVHTLRVVDETVHWIVTLNSRFKKTFRTFKKLSLL